MEFTPDYMLKAGYEYIPWDSAPDDLRATWSQKKSRVVARWKGRKVTILMGGLDGAVDYSGVGIVAYGAEPPAKIVRMAASADNPLEATAAKLGSIFESVFANKTQKSIDGN